MKTYQKNITVPRLVIEYDEDAENPRADDGNIGIFLTKESQYKSPDGATHPLYALMLETEESAKNTMHHIKLMEDAARKAFKESGPKDGNSHDEGLHIIEIHPVYRYEHGAVMYKRGKAAGFDYSNCGFFFITAESLSGGNYTAKKIAKAIDAELQIYNKWINGEIYAFRLYDEKSGEMIESCGGFYDIEDIREYLPAEWKKEKLEEYFERGVI